MIQSFANSTTEKVWHRDHGRKLGPGIQRAAHRKLLILHRAESLADLRVPPGSRLEIVDYH